MPVFGEDELKKVLLELLENDFDIKKECQGTHRLYGNPVRIDFLLYPKDKLIKVGFEPCWFGIEAKHFLEESKSEMARFLYQCITYQQSEFNIVGSLIRPEFVLAFSNKNQETIIKETDYWYSWYGMNQLAALANVGWFLPKLDNFGTTIGWTMRFSTSNHFSRKGNDYKKLEHNIRRYVGNCSK